MRICILLLCFVLNLFAESVAGLRWTAPSGWKGEGARPMRAATYTVPPDAECVVYFFGAGQGGSVEANVDRWKGQFRQPDGKPAAAQTQKRTVHGLAVTTVDIGGDYSGMGGPMAASKTVQSGYRLLGAIVEGPGGNVFLKFTGPAKTISTNQKKFDLLLESFEKER
jgi:hypothetical protein